MGRVSVVILNYGATIDELRTCVASVTGAEGGVVSQIVLVDNGSPVNSTAADDVAAELSIVTCPVRVVRHDRNLGFAGGVNSALPSCHTELVFLLNNDATVEPKAIGEAVRVLDASHDPAVLGVACKMLITDAVDSAERVIDSVGMAVNPAAEAFNIGLGQPDLGQYDADGAPSFGPCFGAGLFRRRAFEPNAVGLLHDHYFLYYEDVEWNWRANLLGFSFVAAPRAVVHHRMSSSTRHLGYDFKFRLIERNLLLTAAELCTPRRALSIWARRGLGLARGAVTGRHYPVASLRALSGAFFHLPRTLRRRRSLQARRVRSDEQLFAFSAGERTFYDGVAYAPIERAAARRFAELALGRRPQ